MSKLKIALIGNPNCGKTTVFNALTGSKAYIGNRAGVTVEKKEAVLKENRDVVIADLPGIYSLSPYTPEEMITRDFIIDRSPDAILNVADASNAERNLYLTCQLLETGLPLVLMMNMADAADKKGIVIDCVKLSGLLGIPVIKASAAKGKGLSEAAAAASDAAGADKNAQKKTPPFFSRDTENALNKIQRLIENSVDGKHLRWYSVKLFERDDQILKKLSLPKSAAAEIESIISDRERRAGDDSQSIIISERYDFVEGLAEKCILKTKDHDTPTQKADRILTGKYTALPCFALIMTIVYFFSAGPVGTSLSGLTRTLVTENAVPAAESFLKSINCAPWLTGLVTDGIIGGVGTVLGFLPQLALLFLMLALLEDWGYMSRAAFIMDRFFRRFGLSGKSFIPMLIATGCGVPAIMSSRTVDSIDRRRITIITATFMPCGAKLPIIAMISSLFFKGAWWTAPVCYFAGAAAVLISGLILKKLNLFRLNEEPFVMELPDYRIPMPANILRALAENCGSFVKRAGTIILLASSAIWFLSGFGFDGSCLRPVTDSSDSILRALGDGLAFIFAPIGFGNWKAAVASIMGLLAKEELVGVFGVLSDASSLQAYDVFGSGLEAFSFLMFNLLCAPCIAAVSTIGKEMKSLLWTGFALLYQTLFAYIVSLCIYRFGLFFTKGEISAFTLTAFFSAAAILFFAFKPSHKKKAPEPLLKK